MQFFKFSSFQVELLLLQKTLNSKYNNYGCNSTLQSHLRLICCRGNGRRTPCGMCYNMVDNETHMVVLARVVDTVKGEGHPMTFPDFITFSQFFG